MNTWTDRFAERMARVRASEIRELLKLLDQPDILSFAGGIPDPQLFPAERLQAAYDQVLSEGERIESLAKRKSEGWEPMLKDFFHNGWLAPMTLADQRANARFCEDLPCEAIIPRDGVIYA